MIVNILIALWFIFILLLIVVTIKRSNGGLIYQFQEIERTEIPYITINIQGISLNMIIDTGAAMSILVANVAQKLNFDVSNRTAELSALTTDSIKSTIISVPMTVNGIHIREDFALYEECDIGNFQRRGIQIHGILSNTFLEKVKGHIDYNKHVLIIH